MRYANFLRAMKDFYLEDFKVEPGLNRISLNGRQTKLPPKQMALLCRLAQQPGQPVERQQLLNDVWQRAMVNDEVLSRNIGELRNVLGDSAKNPQFIETISKKGYRLLVTPGNIGPKKYARLIVLTSAVVLISVVTFGLQWAGRPVADYTNGAKNLQRDIALDARQLSFLPNLEFDAVFSSDGRQLGFSSVNRQAQVSFWLGDPQKVAYRQRSLDIESPGRITLSPDTQTLVYISLKGKQCQLLMEEQGSRQQSYLADCWSSSDNYPIFSPDGLKVAFSHTDGTGSGLSEVDLKTGQIRVITQPGQLGQFDTMPRYSKNASQILFARGDEITRELFLVSVNGGRPQQLTRDHQLTEGHDWLSDNEVVFSSDRLGRRALWQMKIDSGEIKLLGAPGAYGPVYHQTSGQLVYEQPRYRADIHRIDLKQQEQSLSPWLVSSRYDNHPSFSPDGQNIAFVTNRTGLSALWVSTADGQDQRLLFEQAGARVSRPSWRPDGKALLITIYQQDGSYLAEYDLSTDHVLRLDAAGNAASSAVYSQDSQTLYYLDSRQNNSAIWQLKQGLASRVGMFSANRIQVDDLGRVFFSAPKSAGIWMISTTNNEQASRLISTLSEQHWNHWSVAGRGVYFRDHDGVQRYDMETKKISRVTTFVPTSIGISMSISPDEHWMLLSRTEQAESDLMGVSLSVVSP